MDSLIRSITLADVPEYRAALATVCAERHFISLLEPPPIERLEAFVAAILERDDTQFIAEIGGRIVGWCDVRTGSVNTGNAHVGCLGLGVVPEFRRRGIGRRLIEAALTRSRARGLEKIEVRIFASNSAGVALYKALGFNLEGRRVHGRLVDGVYDDVLEMALFLQREAAQKTVRRSPDSIAVDPTRWEQESGTPKTTSHPGVH